MTNTGPTHGYMLTLIEADSRTVTLGLNLDMNNAHKELRRGDLIEMDNNARAGAVHEANESGLSVFM